MAAVLAITNLTDAEIVRAVERVAAELHDIRDENVTLAENASGETAAFHEGIGEGAEVALSLVLSALGIEIGA